MGSMGQMHGANGAMPGMMSGDQVHQLGHASDEAFDRMFLRMMITHHQGAIMMAKAESNTGQSPDALINHNLLASTPNAHTSGSDLIAWPPLTRYQAASAVVVVGPGPPQAVAQ
jgi:hypothetical protein